jgi:hypothetical protein
MSSWDGILGGPQNGCRGFGEDKRAGNVTLRHIRATIVAVEKQHLLRILSVCL